MIHLEQAQFDQKISEFSSVVGNKNYSINAELEVIKTKSRSLFSRMTGSSNTVDTSKVIDRLFQFSLENQGRLTEDNVEKLGKVIDYLSGQSDGKSKMNATMAKYALYGLLFKNTVNSAVPTISHTPVSTTPTLSSCSPGPDVPLPPPPPPASIEKPAVTMPKIPVGGVNLLAEIQGGVKLKHVDTDSNESSQKSSGNIEESPASLIAKQAVNFKLRKTTKPASKPVPVEPSMDNELARKLQRRRNLS